jgi:hypothetical protein
MGKFSDVKIRHQPFHHQPFIIFLETTLLHPKGDKAVIGHWVNKSLAGY